jgi:flagellin-like protein
MIAKRRGISEIFATLMLLAITTAGSVFLASLVYGSGIQNGPNTDTKFQSSYAIKLTGYDTRDSSDLLSIAIIDNKFDKRLCTNSCGGFADNIPTAANSGTEFLILQIRNVSTDPVYIKGIQVNGVLHTWDQSTAGKTLDASTSDFTGKYPLNGKFSIIPINSLTQKSENKVNSDEEVRVVIKLDDAISPDIALAKSIITSINFGSAISSENIIMSGEIR